LIPEVASMKHVVKQFWCQISIYMYKCTVKYTK
jgi:hypothetical protein